MCVAMNQSTKLCKNCSTPKEKLMCCVSFRVLTNFAHVSLRRVSLVKRGRPGRYQERGGKATLTYIKLYGNVPPRRVSAGLVLNRVRKSKSFRLE